MIMSTNSFKYFIHFYFINTEIDAFACDYYTVNDKGKFLARNNCISKLIGWESFLELSNL